MSLLLGLCAAMSWAVHDILVRRVSQNINLLSMLFLVLFFGTLALGPVAAPSEGWQVMTWRAGLLSGLAGLAFAAASFGLYIALSIGPVRLVAPIIGSYPLLSVGWAVINGSAISALQWGAVMVVVGGVALVVSGHDPVEDRTGRRRAIQFSLFAAAGFALTFALSQAATRIGAELPVMFLTRLAALVAIGALLILRGQSWRLAQMAWRPLAVLGLLDTTALGLVISAGALPHPEFAAVSASLFGMFTVILARFILKEPMSARQWGAVAAIFCGIGVLGL